MVFWKAAVFDLREEMGVEPEKIKVRISLVDEATNEIAKRLPMDIEYNFLDLKFQS